MSVFKDKQIFTIMKLTPARNANNVVKPILQSTVGEKAVRGQKPKNGLIQKRQQHHVDFLHSLYFAKKKGIQS